MATAFAEELWNSREGSATGIDGVESATTTWKVGLAEIGDDPVATLRSLAVQPGTFFPWTGDRVVATKFIRAEHPAPLLWHVVVLYETAAFASSATHWQVELSAGLETEHVDFDVNGFPIGQPQYMIAQRFDDLVRAEEEDGASHPPYPRANYELQALYSSMDEDAQVQLHRALDTKTAPFDFAHFSIKGADRTKSSAVLTLHRKCPVVTSEMYATALSHLNTLNRDVFYGAAVDTLKVIAVNVREVEGIFSSSSFRDQITKGRIEGVIFDVSLSFLWNPDKHMPLRTYHTFTGQDGLEHPIVGPGILDSPSGAQWTQNDLYKRSHFRSLLAGFGT
jgi:hypothetical protein